MSRKQRLHDQLVQAIVPEILIIEDETFRHHVPSGSETHFKLIAVANYFTNLTRLERHRAINTLLQDEFNTGLHALSLHLYTPEEWQCRPESVRASPACREGMRHDTK